MFEFIVRSCRLASMIAAALLVAACATAGSKSTPSAPGSETPGATKAAGAEVTGPAMPTATAKPDTYLVQPGDTLALIARRPEIYGDSSMWMLLYRANSAQLPNRDWLCPGQLLAVPRSFTQADADAARQEALRRVPWSPGTKPKARATYLCDGLPRRSSVGASPITAGAAAQTKTRPAVPGVPSGAERAVGSDSAHSAELRDAPKTASPITLGTSANAYLDAARRAYNMRDIPWATHYYRQHLAKLPRDADALGELGNIYYRAGDQPAAAQLFYDAARVLLEKGKRDSAARLLLAVSEGNPALADDLYARLSAPGRLTQ